MALDLRLPVAEALGDLEDPIGEWVRDVHERPTQSLDFEITDRDGNLLVTLNGTLRLHPLVVEQADGSKVASYPTRKQVIQLIRASLLPPVADEDELALAEPPS